MRWVKLLLQHTYFLGIILLEIRANSRVDLLYVIFTLLHFPKEKEGRGEVVHLVLRFLLRPALLVDP